MTAISPPLLVFIGPSATGKSSVVRRLVESGVIAVHPTWTTRPRRHDEMTGSVEHHFVSEAEFLHRRADGFFLHSLQLFGMPYWYGLPTIERTEGTVDAVMLRARLVPILRSVYPDLLIYQIDAAREVVECRLVSRGCPTAERDARLADNEHERVVGQRIAHRRFHNHRSLDLVVHDVERAIRSDFAPALMEER